MAELNEDHGEPTDSLKKRYTFKVVSNFVGLLGNILIQAIVPRSLGPQSFGSFNYLTNFFDQVMEIVDARSSTGVLVKASLRPNEPPLFVFYVYFAVIAVSTVLLGVGLIFVTGAAPLVWPEQVPKFILLAFVWSAIVWLHGILHKLCDAYGLTLEAEWVRIQQKIISVVLIVGMFLLHIINLNTFFYYYIGTLIYLLVGFAMILIRHGRWPARTDWRLPLVQARIYAREFLAYSSPVLILIAVESFVALIDRWVLQQYAGSVEQGYFGFAYQIGYLSIIFVSAMAPLIQREFAVAHASKNIEKMAYLFERYMPMLYSIAAFFAGFVAFQSDKLIGIFAGKQFSESTSVLIVMAFFPIYFTYGRVASSIFFATGRTRLFRNIGLTVHFLGLGLSWFLLAQKSSGGLDMGALGLAIKLVLIQALLVNTQLVFGCMMLNIPYTKNLAHQVLSLALFLVLSYLAKIAADRLAPGMVLGFFTAGVLYSLAVGLLVYAAPPVFGLWRSDIDQLRKFARRRVGRSV